MEKQDTIADPEEELELSGHFTIFRLLQHAVVPVFTLLLASLYMVVDGLFIANFTSETAYAGSVLASAYTMIFPAVGFMVGGGGNALLGKLLGENDRKRTNEVFSMLLEFTAISGLLFTLLGEVFFKPYLLFQGASGKLLEEALLYGNIALTGTVFLALQYVFQLFLITAGEEVRAFVYTLIAGVLNIVLDAVFILLLKMGVAGAAIGTLIGEIVGTVLPFLFFLRQRENGVFFFRLCRLAWRPIYDACFNGLSEMVENIAESIVGVIYNFHLLRSAGEAGVDAYGSIMYVFMIYTLTFVGFNESVVPVIGYHYGAGNRKELRSLFHKCLIICGTLSVLFFAATELFAPWFAAIFADGNQEILNMTVRGFRIIGFSLLPMGMSMFIPSLFTGLNDGLTSALITIFEMLLFPALAVTVLSRAFGLTGVWAAEGASWLLSALLCFLIIRRNLRGDRGRSFVS